MRYTYIFTFLLINLGLAFGQSHSQQIESFRQQQRKALSQENKGPIAAQNLQFLHYFLPDTTYKTVANVSYLYDEPTFRMPTSDGTSKEFKRFAELTFTLKGQQFTLPIYENVSLFQSNLASSYLFFPILDRTTGETTYESGRYIDVKKEDIKQGKLLIDFNKAYNPYCAYSSGYRCPQPPKENYLDIAVEAGEKKYTGPKNQREQDNSMAKNFNDQEKKLISAGKAEEKMYVLQTTVAKDSTILRTQSEDVKYDDTTLDLLAARMLATVQDPDHPGVGIAAPQVGINKNLIWVQRLDKVDEPFELYINPKIVWRSQLLRKGAEGCLSIPNRREDVIRNYSIKLQHVDKKTGKNVEELIEGFTAVIFQHEVDHLYGILFPDRLEEQEQKESVLLNERLEFYMGKGTIVP
ncbi:peptide deformylase [Sphingobacterium paludis]|uniref:Peptide deformylase n=1 Tax=Sphingobacterium paludis TaxID=1476465 RepID=A0A4R7D5Q8_9SPHI|nr:peptide deformylase [Sphingobacterium paludis]TDS15692.1 peptide deformylase [Sphingobacterium paludis]